MQDLLSISGGTSANNCAGKFSLEHQHGSEPADRLPQLLSSPQIGQFVTAAPDRGPPGK
jgi:hypothetical protein